MESCLEGVCKPDPRIYHLCAERLSVQPAEAIFLDDIGQNLKAAAQLGFTTIKVSGYLPSSTLSFIKFHVISTELTKPVKYLKFNLC